MKYAHYVRFDSSSRSPYVSGQPSLSRSREPSPLDENRSCTLRNLDNGAVADPDENLCCGSMQFS